MDKKLKNELFKVAVDYLFQKKKVGSQKELAEKIGITEQSLSRVMNNGRIVSDKTLRKMNEAFGGIFNMAYFRGEDPHCMLMEDLAFFKQHPEKRLVFVKPKDNAQPESTQTSINDTTLIMSKMFESMLRPIEAAHAQHVATLNQQLADKDTLIAEKQARIVALEQAIKDKEKIIQDRDARIITLERQLSEAKASDITQYPFPLGAAEDRQHANVSPQIK